MSRKAPLFLLIVCVLAVSVVTGSAQWPPPSEQTNGQYRNNPCRDPWISYGYIIASAGTYAAQGSGDIGECNCNLYNYCRWGSFEELVNHIRDYRDTLWRNGLAIRAVPMGGGQVRLETVQFGRVVGQIVAGGGGNILNQSGANIVAGGGGNLIGDGGGTFTQRGQDGVLDIVELKSGVKVLLKSDPKDTKKDDKK